VSKPEEYNPTEFNPELANYELGIEYGQRLAEERIIKLLDREIQKLQGNPNDQLIVEITSRLLKLIALIKGEQNAGN
jgi:hypothetical protein